MKYLVGIDIGGTKCAVILGALHNCPQGNTPGKVSGNDETITILDRVSFPTEVQKGPGHTIGRIIDSVDLVLSKNSKRAEEICRIGISCGGPLDSRRGIILSPPNLVGWDNIHIAEIIEAKYNVRAKLQNDANACALAEWRFGSGKGFKNVVFLTFGTGMGAGLILDGRLYSGTNDLAGEVGHIRLDANGPAGYGKAGSFEGFCSGGGIAQLARTMVLERLQMGETVSFCDGIDRLDSLNAKVVADAAVSGDELAMEIFRVSGYYLGKGLSIIIDMLNPEIIIIGGIFSRCRELLWPKAYEVIRKEALSLSQNVCRVAPAALGEKIGDYAALAVAANE